MLLSALALSLALIGCGLVSPAVRLLSGPGSNPTPRVVERTVVVTPESQTAAEKPAAEQAQDPPVQIQIAPGADLETQIYSAVYRKVNPSVVYIENLTNVPTGNNPRRLCQKARGPVSSGTLQATSSPIITWWKARMHCR